LDEPLSALDANLRRQMQMELKSLQREVGISFVFVTHDQEEAMVMSDRIALLRMGELEQVASPREIYSRPATAYTAQFIGHTNLLRGKVSEGFLQCHSLRWKTSLADGPALLSLRPENVRPRGETGRSVDSFVLKGTIPARAFKGPPELLRFEWGAGLKFWVRPASKTDPAGEVEFQFDPADAVPIRESAERS